MDYTRLKYPSLSSGQHFECGPSTWDAQLLSIKNVYAASTGNLSAECLVNDFKYVVHLAMEQVLIGLDAAVAIKKMVSDSLSAIRVSKQRLAESSDQEKIDLARLLLVNQVDQSDAYEYVCAVDSKGKKQVSLVYTFDHGPYRCIYSVGDIVTLLGFLTSNWILPEDDLADIRAAAEQYIAAAQDNEDDAEEYDPNQWPKIVQYRPSYELVAERNEYSEEDDDAIGIEQGYGTFEDEIYGWEDLKLEDGYELVDEDQAAEYAEYLENLHTDE